MMSANEADGKNRFVVTRSTVFHRAVVFGALIVSVAAFLFASPEWSIGARLLLAAIAGVIGFLVSLATVVWVVGAAIIPRLRPGSFWQGEVHDFMLSVIGTKWDRVGEKPPDV
jgi:hypothetical protein